jgi:hypothetical protein
MQENHHVGSSTKGQNANLCIITQHHFLYRLPCNVECTSQLHVSPQTEVLPFLITSE